MLAPEVKSPAVETTATLEPLALWQSLLLFAIPGILFRLVLYNGTGFMVTHGVSEAAAVISAFLVPSLLLLAASFVALRLDGYSLSWSTVATRFRFRRLNWRSWLWALGGTLLVLVAVQVLAFAAPILVRIPAFTPPSYLAFLNPTVRQSVTSMLGVPLRGNWEFLAIFTGVVIIQVAAEECWWRGYIFPRQERVYGRWTWLVHGLLWTGFHFIFYPWEIVGDLFFCTTVAAIAQRTKNTGVTLIVHLLYNGLTPVILLLIVLGVIH